MNYIKFADHFKIAKARSNIYLIIIGIGIKCILKYKQHEVRKAFHERTGGEW